MIADNAPARAKPRDLHCHVNRQKWFLDVRFALYPKVIVSGGGPDPTFFAWSVATRKMRPCVAAIISIPFKSPDSIRLPLGFFGYDMDIGFAIGMLAGGINRLGTSRGSSSPSLCDN